MSIGIVVVPWSTWKWKSQFSNVTFSMREKERLLEGVIFSFLLNVDNILAHLENIFVNCLLADAKIKLKSENNFLLMTFLWKIQFKKDSKKMSKNKITWVILAAGSCWVRIWERLWIFKRLRNTWKMTARSMNLRLLNINRYKLLQFLFSLTLRSSATSAATDLKMRWWWKWWGKGRKMEI